jgi:hypothetical protein
VIVGGTFDVASTAHVTTDTEDGVTIFLTGSGSDYAKVTINGGAHIDIVATTDGEYKGLAFFQDRDAPVISSGSPNKLNGGSSMNITGAIYFPNQRLSFSGNNSEEGTCTRIVALHDRLHRHLPGSTPTAPMVSVNRRPGLLSLRSEPCTRPERLFDRLRNA